MRSESRSWVSLWRKTTSLSPLATVVKNDQEQRDAQNQSLPVVIALCPAVEPADDQDRDQDHVEYQMQLKRGGSVSVPVNKNGKGRCSGRRWPKR